MEHEVEFNDVVRVTFVTAPLIAFRLLPLVVWAVVILAMPGHMPSS